MSMTQMRRVGKNHVLALCLKTDRTMLLKKDSVETEVKPLFYFNSDLYGYTPDGVRVCKIGLADNSWYLREDEHGIEVPARDFHKPESVFDIEKDFLEKWLAAQGVEA